MLTKRKLRRHTTRCVVRNHSAVQGWAIYRCHRLFGTPGNMAPPYRIILGNMAPPQEIWYPHVKSGNVASWVQNILVNVIPHAKYPSQFDGKVRKMKLGSKFTKTTVPLQSRISPCSYGNHFTLFMVPFMAAIAHHHLLLYLGCKPAVAININDLRFLCLLLAGNGSMWSLSIQS